MYVPKQFEETNVKVMHALMREHPLATVITLSSNGLNANHLPLHLSEVPAPYGTLRGHVARSNPLLNDATQDQESLVIFHGPECYITPAWYATKQETGKVAPTWNYAVVHAYGMLNIIDDPSWLRIQLQALTAHNEAAFESPWVVDDAPREFTDMMIEKIVGFELVITRLIGKWKVNQNQPARNQASVIAGLKASGQPGDLAMAALVQAAGNTEDL
jgi:transcriptional regulator